jgi:hypothetical protein
MAAWLFFVLQLADDLVVIKGQRARRTAGTIDDCRNFALVTQAAARTFPLVFTKFCNQIEIFSHWRSPKIGDN